MKNGSDLRLYKIKGKKGKKEKRLAVRTRYLILLLFFLFLSLMVCICNSSLTCLFRLGRWLVLKFVLYSVKYNRGTNTYAMNVENSPPLCPPVLKPGFHLRIRHFQSFSQGCPFGRRQILLFVKTFLQFGDLQPGEACPRLLSLRRRPILVRMADPPWKRSSYCRKQK